MEGCNKLFCLAGEPDFRVVKATLAEGSVGFQMPAPEVGPCVVPTGFGDTTAAPSCPARLQPSQQEPNHGRALVVKRMDQVPRQEILQQPCPLCHPSSMISTRRGAPRRTPSKHRHGSLVPVLLLAPLPHPFPKITAESIFPKSSTPQTIAHTQM